MKVLATTSSYEIGLTGLLTDQALHIQGQCAPDQFLFISGEREQYPGLFAKLREHSVRNERIAGFDKHHHLLELVKTFDHYINDFKPDVVHVNTNWQLVIAVLAKYLYRHRFAVIYTIHGYRHNYPVRAIWARFLIGGMLYLFADRVIAPSSFLRRQFSFLGSRIDTLFIGVYTSYLSPYVPLPMDGPKRIIFAGAFREGKNQDLLIRVLKQYIQVTGDTKVELYLPGDGPRLAACMNLCKELDLEERVFFPGFVNREKMLEYYRMCQFAVVPSNVETFGQCVAEPFALGRVVMSRRVGVAEDVIIDGETGYLFDTEEQLLQLLLTVLPNPATWGKVSRAAYDCRHLFDWGPICSQYLKIVNEHRLAILTNTLAPYRIDFFARIGMLSGILSRVFVHERPPSLGSPLFAAPVRFDYEYAPSIRINAKLGNDRYLSPGLLFRVWRFRPRTIVVGGAPFAALEALILKFALGSGVLIWWGGTDRSERDRSWIVRIWRRWMFKRVDGFLAYSRECVRYLEGQGVAAARIKVLGNNTLDVKQGPPVALTRTSGGVGETDQFTILVVSRLIPSKNVLGALDVFERLVPDVRNATLLIAGGGPERKEIMAACRLRHLAGVKLLGQIPAQKMPSVYAGADVLLHMARYDQWPQAINEAMAYGIPVIVSSTSGIDEGYVQHGVNGFIVDPDDVQGAAELLRRLSHDRSLRVLMSQRAHETAKANDVNAVVGRFQQAIANF